MNQGGNDISKNKTGFRLHSDPGRLICENFAGSEGFQQLNIVKNDKSGYMNLLVRTTNTINYNCCCIASFFPPSDACELSLDPNTANRNLCLSEDNRQVTVVKEEQPYPDHPDRFVSRKQLLCSQGLTGRCYWEVQWKGRVSVGVTYRGIRRRGDSNDCCIGWNDHSWSLFCSDGSYAAWHNNRATDTDTAPSSHSDRVGVYLDWPAGTLSFYTVSSDARILLHTFHSTFTEPLYPGFEFGVRLGFGAETDVFGSSVSL